MIKTAFIIDSSSGIKKKELTKYDDTFLIPMPLNFPDGTEIDDDENVIKFDEFYKILEYQVIKTSQIPLGKMIKKWDEILEKYDNIVFIGLSKGLSGQHQSITMLANEEKYQNKVYVIDTDGVSQLNVKYFDCIYHWVKDYKVSLDKLQSKIDELKQNVSTFIIPKSLKILKRGGRITPAAAALASILKIVPILCYDGKIDKFDKTRIFKKAIETALEQIKKERKNWKNIILIYSKTDEETLNDVKKIIKDFGSNVIETHILSNIIAAHTGPNTIVLVCWDL